MAEDSPETLWNRIFLNGERPPRPDRWRFVAAPNRGDFEKVDLGVVFLMAFWSGGCRQTLMQFRHELFAWDPEGKLEVVVADIDGLAEEDVLDELRGRSNGWGEIAWIRAGQVLKVTSSPTSRTFFKPYIEMLVDSAQG